MNTHTASTYLKYAIAMAGAKLYKETLPVTLDTIEEWWDEEEFNCITIDGTQEIRYGDVRTELDCPPSRDYETESVAMLIEGRWVGWTYYFGGGKYGEPEHVDFIEDAYFLGCEEKEVTIIQRTFTKT